jgi:pimeloyl-ACP methyl ester carboxylesterase
MPIQLILLGLTTVYGAIACLLEDQSHPAGTRISVDGRELHLSVVNGQAEGQGNATIVLDHSLGGIEGYLVAELLAEQLSQQGRVCFYDRAGYGWSDHSLEPRTSDRIVTELDILLTQAGIAPPYILIGDSFGSYNMRLYADRYPEKVAGLILTDGLHESGMLGLPIGLKLLKLLFISGFLMATIGAALGIIRVLKDLGFFEILKPELRRYSPNALNAVTRSFCRPKHWITMARELWSMDESSRQMQPVQHLGNLPIVSIKSASFFKPALWTHLIPLGQANALRDRMHEKLLTLSTQSIQIQAKKSGHFVWIDEPDLLTQSIVQIIRTIKSQ